MWNGVSYTQSVDLRSKRKILRCITFVYYITANAELWGSVSSSVSGAGPSDSLDMQI